jgi:hypothetical protein
MKPAKTSRAGTEASKSNAHEQERVRPRRDQEAGPRRLGGRVGTSRRPAASRHPARPDLSEQLPAARAAASRSPTCPVDTLTGAPRLGLGIVGSTFVIAALVAATHVDDAAVLPSLWVVLYP